VSNAIVEMPANLREKTGKSAAKQARRQGLIPGVFYQGNDEPVHLSFKLKDVQNLIVKHPPTLTLVWSENEDGKHECIIREVQYHPVTQLPVHLDFMGITSGVKIEATVRIRLVGTPEGVRTSGGILQQLMNEVDIWCLPKDIPDVLKIDVSPLKVGESIHLSAIQMEGIEWITPGDRTVANVVAPTIVRAAAKAAEEAEEEGEKTVEETKEGGEE